MDLALHLGCTVVELEERLTEHEFDLWLRYAQARMLPWRRVELYLAQVALTIAQVNGNEDLSLTDFMFDQATGADAADTAEEFFGFNPRVKEK